MKEKIAIKMDAQTSSSGWWQNRNWRGFTHFRKLPQVLANYHESSCNFINILLSPALRFERRGRAFGMWSRDFLQKFWIANNLITIASRAFLKCSQNVFSRGWNNRLIGGSGGEWIDGRWRRLGTRCRRRLLGQSKRATFDFSWKYQSRCFLDALQCTG